MAIAIYRPILSDAIISRNDVWFCVQDLLQLQYEGLAIMKMFGRAKINVNLLIYLINKKFYGRVL